MYTRIGDEDIALYRKRSRQSGVKSIYGIAYTK